MFKLTLLALVASIAAAKDGSEFNGTNYISQSRSAKSDQIWSKITANTKSGSWHLAGALIVDQAPVFDTPGDELPCYWNGCRNKTIHAQGSVAKVQWVSVGQHPYTGMFRGADAGYVRFSVAKPVDTKTPNLAPGMGVKLLRDGVDSANFVSMYSVDGQDTLNFFANDFTNHIPDATSISLKPLEARFATQTNQIRQVGLSEMASARSDGMTESPVFPFSMRFSPTGQYNFASTVSNGYTDFMTDLATIRSGSVLYDIYAMDQPAELGGVESYIGQLVSASEFTSSNWGDEHLYIRHQRMDADLELRPEWKPYTPAYEGFFSLQQETNKPGCPFANIMQYLQ